MTDSRLDRLSSLLWHPGEAGRAGDLYAVLDGARDPRIHAMLRRSNLDCRCLYDGDLPEELAEVSPFLVALPLGSPITSRLLRAAWGQAWGILMRTSVGISALRRHLRRFLLVRDDGDRAVMFRYFDPRVLRIFLPTCTGEELRRLFGPIHDFYAEDEAGAALIHYWPAAEGLSVKAIALDDSAPIEPPAPGAAKSIEADRPNVDALRPMRLRAAQMAAFRDASVSRFEDSLAASIRQRLPGHHMALGEKGVRAAIRHGIRRSADYGLTTEWAVSEYVKLMLLFGRDFDRQAGQTWAGPPAEIRKIADEKARVQRLHAGARDHLRRVMAEAREV